MNILYSTHCPKCNVLIKKMELAGIDFTVNENVQEMIDKGMKSAPALEVDGKMLDFKAALDWVKEQG